MTILFLANHRQRDSVATLFIMIVGFTISYVLLGKLLTRPDFLRVLDEIEKDPCTYLDHFLREGPTKKISLFTLDCYGPEIYAALANGCPGFPPAPHSEHHKRFSVLKEKGLFSACEALKNKKETTEKKFLNKKTKPSYPHHSEASLELACRNAPGYFYFPLPDGRYVSTAEEGLFKLSTTSSQNNDKNNEKKPGLKS